MISFLRFALIHRHSKKKWSTIMANHQVRMNKKMLNALVVKKEDKTAVVPTVISENDTLISIVCQF